MANEASAPKDPALLLKLLRERKKAAAGGDAAEPRPGQAAAIPRCDRSRPLPASFAQERLWLLDRLSPGGSTFNMPFPLRLRGRLDVDALARALAALELRHESLRTTFQAWDEGVFQVLNEPRFRLETVDLQGEIDLALSLQTRVDAEARFVFDLERGPLFRALLLRLAPEEHVLVINLHHVISDGWSSGVLFRELRALLAAFAAGEPAGPGAPSPLPELPLQYPDFAAWQRSPGWSAELQRQIDYWRVRLDQAAPTLALPTDRPRPASTGSRNGTIGLRLDEALTSGLRQLASRNGCSLFMPLLAAFKILLHRLSGQEDILVGTPVAGRNRRELEDLIGIFLNTLVLRTQVNGELTFRQALLRVRDTVLGATAHQDLPFEKLLIELQPERQLNQSPYFQVFFNMANIPDLHFELPGLEVSFEPMPELGSKFDLNLYALEQGPIVLLNLVYNPDLFDRARVLEMAAQLESLLQQAVAEPERLVGGFELVTPGARALLPDPRAPLPASWPGSVTDLFAARAAESPDAVAVEDPWTTVSYGRLAARMDRLAARLAAAGVARGEVVAIWAHRSALLPEALLGILRRGAAFVMLDPAYPPSRLADFVGLARPTALVVLAGAPPIPTEADVFLPALRLPLAAAEAAAEEEAAPAPGDDFGVGPDDLAYYAFTSGSTGKPKAILGGHGSLTAFLPFAAERFGFGPGDRNSLLSALSHDPLHRDVFYSLCLGMTVVAPDAEQLGSPGYLARWVRDRRLTVLNLVPAMLQLLVEETPGQEAVELPELRRVMTVGEALKRAEVERLYAMAPQAICFNLYGATETQRALSFLELPRRFAGAAGEEDSRGLQKAVLPLGRGIDGVQLLVLNPRKALAGVGELGETVFRSRYLALGYADPAQTREKFEVNPFTGDPRDRLYHTGDLGRFLPGGGVEFAGRTDFQVKIRGFRVELPEIEAVLRQHPDIREAVVVLREEENGEKRLAGYFTSRGDAPSGRELRELLLKSLPDYMVPSAFVALEAFPLSRNGKIDRRALPAPQAEARAGRRLPTQPDQQVLATLFGRLLGREEIALDDHFFELGGHSLLATQLLSRVRAAFGVALPLRSIFERPTLEAFAAHLQEQRGQAARTPPLAPRPAALRRRAPLSFSQQRLFFLEQLEPGSNAYLLFGALRLAGPLDRAALGRALQRLAARHEALRTRVVTDNGEAFQEISENAGAPLGFADLSALPPAAAAAAALERARELAHAPIATDAARLWRAELLRLTASEQGGEQGGEHFFLLAIHHLVADGWSLGIFLRELGALYGEELGGQPADLAPLAIQPADFAVWERYWLRGEALDEQLAFWRGHLAGAPPALELPTDFLRPATPSHQGQRLPLVLPAPLAEGLRAFGREQGATLFMVLLAGFDILLSQLSGQQAVVVGTPVAHRDRAELEGPIGFFANTLPLRLDVQSEIGFAELVANLRRNLLDAFSHQDLPFEKLVAELGVERDLARSPIFQAFFGLQNVGADGEAFWGEASLSRLEVPVERAQFDFQWTAVERGGGGELGGFLEWSADLFARETVERWSRRLLSLFEAVLRDPQRKLGALDVRLPEDLAFAAAFSATERPFDLALPVHHRVADNARRAPGAPALGLEGELAYGYGELDAAAGRLAVHLRRQGVGPESVVGLSIGRLPSLVVAQLAVWKAGAAYLPLDPIYPPERLAFMLEDAGARLLLVDSRGEAAPASLLEKAGRVIDLAEETAWQDAGEPPAAAADPRALAYVLYTSGSTGKPKGVMVEHGALVNFLLSMAEKPGLAASDRLLSLTTMSFDISGLEIWLPLLAGARVDLAGRDTVKDGDALAAAIARTEASFVQATPATWRLLLDSGWAGAPRLKALCGGEALPGELAERLLAKVGALWNVYGPTETTIWSTLRRVEPGELPAVVPLGSPIANTAIRILGRGGVEVAPGIAGELAIGGAGLARGYLGRPALTAEKFVPDPAGAPGARLYRSGDLARLRMDGELEFLGRLDFQVKVRGFRIELGEIEATLEKHPAVAQAVVVAGRAPDGGSRLIGYYRLAEGAAAEPFELQTWLHQSLPDYMVPALLMRLEIFPLTPNLKVDRKSLPAPETLAERAPRRPPQTEVEKILAAIWSELLLTDDIGLDDNYFALGGDSILVIKVVARARQHQLGIFPRDLFMAPTLEALAALAQKRDMADEPAAPPAIVDRQGVELVGAEMSDEDLASLLDDLAGG